MNSGNLPDVFLGIQSSLEPYLRSRQETATIRRTLATHLTSQCAHSQLPRPLSLAKELQTRVPIKKSIGYHDEYVQALHLYSRAKVTYDAVRDGLTIRKDSPYHDIDSTAPKQTFADLVRARQKYERLRIIQDYVNTLNEKPCAGQNSSIFKDVLEKTGPPPKIPAEILSVPKSTNSVSGGLDTLVEKLEKEVLRAKVLLRKEQSLLNNAQSKESQNGPPNGSRLAALGTARNELITWIETELSQANDKPIEDQHETPSAKPSGYGEGYLQAQLDTSAFHYKTLISARGHLIDASERYVLDGGSPKLPMPGDAFSTVEPTGEDKGMESTPATILPYLTVMLQTAAEQKALVNQKSYAGVVLAKHLKAVTLGLDRLVEESHLLPAHATGSPAFLRGGTAGSGSFGEDILGEERPDITRRVQPWVQATEAANNLLRDQVSENLHKGGSELLEAQETLLELLSFLGTDSEVKESSEDEISDIWAALNGKLGVI